MTATKRPSSISQRSPGMWARARPLRVELIAALAAAACYINILPNDFCYDDHAIVRLNPTVNEPEQWLAIWATDYWSEAKDASPDRDLLYRPTAMMSYRLVRMIAGPGPLWHHVVNLLLHALVSAMVARLCRRMGGSETAALVAGLVFAVLPIHTEAVAAVTGRADSLAALGILLAVLCHRRSMFTTGSWRLASWRVLAAVAAFGAMGAKESGVCVVAIVALFDALWFGKSRLAGEGQRWVGEHTLGQGTRSGATGSITGVSSLHGTPRGLKPAARWWRGTSHGYLGRLVYLLIPLAVYLALRYQALEGHFFQRPALTKTVNVLVDAPPWQHALGVAQLWGMYWAKTIWPKTLCIGYSINAIHLAMSPLDLYVLLGAFVAAGLVVASVIAWRRGSPGTALLAAAIVISCAPTANALILIRVFFAERVWYLPTVWIAILAGLAAARLRRHPAWYVIVVLIISGMMARCWIRNAEWRDDGTLTAAAYRDLPDAVAVLHLHGQWLAEHGRHEKGVELMEHALAIDLGFTDAHRSLGAAHLRAKKYEAALRHWQIANMQVPYHPPTVAGLQRAQSALLSRERTELVHLRQQADQNPDDVDAELALVRKLRALALTEEALARFQEHAERFEGNAAWQIEYAVTLVFLDRLDPAIERYRRALELDPTDVGMAVELAMLLLERRREGDLDEARRWAMHASNLAPKSPIVLVCRAELAATGGDLEAAVAFYREAIRALPPGSPQRRVWQERMKTLGG